jgi:hypothetical protein
MEEERSCYPVARKPSLTRLSAKGGVNHLFSRRGKLVTTCVHQGKQKNTMHQRGAENPTGGCLWGFVVSSVALCAVVLAITGRAAHNRHLTAAGAASSIAAIAGILDCPSDGTP